MTHPERLYFPLDKAAKELDCDINDLIHWAANGNIRICTKIILDHVDGDASDIALNLWPIVDEELLDKYVSELVIDDNDPFPETIEVVPHHYTNSYYSYGGDFILNIDIKNKKALRYEYVLRRFMGLVEIGATDFYRNENQILNSNFFEAGWLRLPIEDSNTISGFFSDSFDEKQCFVICNSSENGFTSLYLNHEKGYDSLKLYTSDLYITKDQIDIIKGVKRVNTNVSNVLVGESPKTSAKKSEIIRPLLQLLPEFSDVDLDTFPVSRIKEIVEKIAISKKVELPETHSQTWAKYLGRGRYKE